MFILWLQLSASCHYPTWFKPWYHYTTLLEIHFNFLLSVSIPWFLLRTRSVLQPITATTWTLHCAALLKCRGSKGFGGGRHRIDNWSNLLHHAGFLLKNGKMAKICMVATSQMPGSIIKLSQYYHTTIPTPHSSQTCKYHPSLALLRPHIYMMTCSSEIYF